MRLAYSSGIPAWCGGWSSSKPLRVLGALTKDAPGPDARLTALHMTGPHRRRAYRRREAEGARFIPAALVRRSVVPNRRPRPASGPKRWISRGCRLPGVAADVGDDGAELQRVCYITYVSSGGMLALGLLPRNHLEGLPIAALPGPGGMPPRRARNP
jgi:hypothetical protein